MDIVKLKTFLILCECGSFSETAELLYCSQPAVSKQIKSLEEDLNVPLFNRMRKNISLTLQGEHFKDYAEEIVRLYENSKEHIRQLEDLKEGRLFFGSTNFIGVHILPHYLKEFQNHYPAIEPNLVIASSQKLFNQLEKHKIEFVFLSHYVDFNQEHYVVEKFCEDELVIVLNKNHRLAHQDSCFLKELENELFITKLESSSLNMFLEKKLGTLNFKKRIIVNNQEAIKKAVIEGLGIAIMSKEAVELEVQAGLIKTLAIQDQEVKRDINLVYDKRKHLTPAANAFISLLGIEEVQLAE